MSIKIDVNFIKQAERSALQSGESSLKLVSSPSGLPAGMSPEYLSTSSKSFLTSFGGFTTTSPAEAVMKHYDVLIASLGFEYEELKQISSISAKLFDLGHWWQVNAQLNQAFFTLGQIVPDNFPTELHTILRSIHEQYLALPDADFRLRARNLMSYLWYALLSIKMDGVNEYDFWSGWMPAFTCPTELENLSYCIKLLAGHQVDDRDQFLARLRKPFAVQLAAVGKGKCQTCYCEKRG